MTEEVNYSVGQLLEAINNKADLDGSNLDDTSFESFINSLVDAKLGNIDYVVESKLPTEEDPYWYRVYKSGWVEQGGVYSFTSNAEGKLNFLKVFADTNYTLFSQPITLGLQNYADGYQFIYNKTTTGFTHKSFMQGNANWYACGQSA